MLRLTEKSPAWKDVLPGVRIEFAPPTNKAWRAARRAAAAALGRPVGDADLELREEAGDAFSRVLIAAAILAWDGIGDAEGNPISPTPETIALLLADPRWFEACDTAYVLPLVLEQAEGNVSAGSPNGISAEAMPATITATSRAKPRKARGAANVRTSRKSRAPKTA